MISYSPSPSKPASIPLVEVNTPVLGGLGGPANVGAQALGDYCKYLDDLLAAQSALLNTIGVLPLSALSYPTIDTADNKWTITKATATNGGTVAIPAGRKIAIAEEISAGVSGRMGLFTTTAFTSADLAINSTYYLRGYVSGGAITLYVQKGTDADTIPAGLKGTPNGSSGGGFDSTVLDVLIGKVTTGAAGSTPTTTPMVNAARMMTTVTASGTPANPSSAPFAAGFTGSVTINWARTPVVSVSGHLSSEVVGSGAYLEGGVNIIRNITATRYTVSANILSDWGSTGATSINAEIRFHAVC